MILITGATGFLGSYLAKSLINKGEKVRALKRPASRFELLGKYAQKIDWVEADLLDITSLENALDGIEQIYHCAGTVSSALLQNTQAGLTHTHGTANLLNVAIDKQVKKVLHVSSTIALGMPANGKVIDENYYAPVGKNTPVYFKTKRHSELEAWRAHAEGLPVVIVNPGGILGAGYWNHEPLNMFQSVYEGLGFYTTGANAFIDIRDAVAVIIKLMESNISGERFILTAENIELKELLIMIADELKIKRPKFKLTHLLSELAWRYEATLSLLAQRNPNFTKDDLRIAQIPFRYNNSKIIEATGYKFKSIAESVYDTAQYFLESKKKGLDYAVFG